MYVYIREESVREIQWVLIYVIVSDVCFLLFPYCIRIINSSMCAYIGLAALKKKNFSDCQCKIRLNFLKNKILM